MHPALRTFALLALAGGLAACRAAETAERPAHLADDTGAPFVARESTVTAFIEAAGLAAPIAEATMSTRLMATVTEVAVREGDRVTAGALLVRLDARDLAARRSQVEAGIAQAEAMRADAATHAGRIRALYADSAAPRAMLDAAETGLARADAAVRSARAAAAELAAVTDYAEVRAPFAGLVAQRLVDPGAFAAPGAPLVTVLDGSRLRVTVSAAPSAVRGLRPGARLNATIEGEAADAVIEGLVPAAGGATWEVNAIVDNRDGRFLPHSAATLALPAGERQVILLPASAVRREGDLAIVRVRTAGTVLTRYVRLGASAGDRVEALSGIATGDTLLVPAGSH